MLEKNIFITGFMGTGKSTVGRYLAQKTGKIFLDMDNIIESQEGCSISDLFSIKGETYFRKLETKVLKEICQRRGIIVATGGGTFLSEENIELAHSCGDIILLKAAPEVIAERLKKETDSRPLLWGRNYLTQIKTLLNKRQEKYNRFENQIDTSNLTIKQVVAKIMNYIGRI